METPLKRKRVKSMNYNKQQVDAPDIYTRLIQDAERRERHKRMTSTQLSTPGK